MTVSEQIFERLCVRNNFAYERIMTQAFTTPDYLLHLALGQLVVEIKQFDAGPGERKTLRKVPEEWNESDAYFAGRPGERVRSKIDAAMRQLKRLAGSDLPTLLVLYDNIQLWDEICDPHAIAVALYGTETIYISAEPAPEGGATILARWHGDSRRATPSQNTSLSAIGLITHEEDREALSIYHNYYAKNPLPIAALNGDCFRHFRLRKSPAEEFSQWVLC